MLGQNTIIVFVYLRADYRDNIRSIYKKYRNHFGSENHVNWMFGQYTRIVFVQFRADYNRLSLS